MISWEINNADSWLIAPKPAPSGERILFEPGKARPYLLCPEVNGKLGLAVFSTKEWAEKHIQDAGLLDMEPFQPDYLSILVRLLSDLFPKLTYLILDPIGGHRNVRIAPIADFLKNNPA